MGNPVNDTPPTVTDQPFVTNGAAPKLTNEFPIQNPGLNPAYTVTDIGATGSRWGTLFNEQINSLDAATSGSVSLDENTIKDTVTTSAPISTAVVWNGVVVEHTAVEGSGVNTISNGNFIGLNAKARITKAGVADSALTLEAIRAQVFGVGAGGGAPAALAIGVNILAPSVSGGAVFGKNIGVNVEDQTGSSGGDLGIRVLGATTANAFVGPVGIGVAGSIVGSGLMLRVVGASEFTGAASFGSTVSIAGKLTVSGAIDPTALILDEQVADIATAANEGAIYDKTVAGVGELFYRYESNGTVIQITGGGSLVTDRLTKTGTTIILTQDGLDQYLTGSLGNINLVPLGSSVIVNAKLGVTGTVDTSDGSAAAPAYRFTGDTSTGSFLAAAGIYGITALGVERARFSSSGSHDITGNLTVTAKLSGLGVAATGTGSAASPAFMLSDNDNGMYLVAANNPGFSAGGVLRLDISTTAFTATLPWRGQNGTAAAPSSSYSSDTDTGDFRVGADNWGVSTGGSLRFDISTTVATMGTSMLLLTAASTTARAGFRIPEGTAPTTKTAGDLWNDSTQKALQGSVAGVEQSLEGVLFTQTASVTVANTITETVITGAGIGTLTLPANFFTPGKTIRFTARGHYSTDAVAPTLRFRFVAGAATILSTTGSQTAPAGAASRGWSISVVTTCRTAGAGGTTFSQGYALIATTAADGQVWDMEATATVALDTTAAQAIDLRVFWGTAAAANTITCTNVMLEVLN